MVHHTIDMSCNPNCGCAGVLVCDGTCELDSVLTLHTENIGRGADCGEACDDLNDNWTITYTGNVTCPGLPTWAVWESDPFSIAGCTSGDLTNRQWYFGVYLDEPEDCVVDVMMTEAGAGICSDHFSHRTAARWTTNIWTCGQPITWYMWNCSAWTDCAFDDTNAIVQVF